MERKRFTAEQIIMNRREAEVGLDQGQTVGQGCKQGHLTKELSEWPLVACPVHSDGPWRTIFPFCEITPYRTWPSRSSHQQAVRGGCMRRSPVDSTKRSLAAPCSPTWENSSPEV